MYKLAVLVTSHPEKWLEIAESWQKTGAPGITIIDSYGLHRIQQSLKHMEIPPGTVSIGSILRKVEENSRIVFSICEEGIVMKLKQEAENILGSLESPNSGIFFVINVDQVFGLMQYR